MWQLQQHRVLVPHTLDDHLGKLHCGQCGFEPTFCGQHIDHRLHQLARIPQHEGVQVMDQIGWEGKAREITLKQNINLGGNSVIFCVCAQGHGQMLGQSLQLGILTLSHSNASKLGGG